MKIAIIGSGLAGLTAAVNLVDEGHEVEIYESRSFWGGKVGSWEDKDGNHIEMGLHVFFYNYANLFKLCLLYTSPSPRDQRGSRMPSSA